MKNIQKTVGLMLIFCFSLIFTSCEKSLNGRWESSSAVSYEFSKNTYIREVNILFTVAKIKGSYKVVGQTIYTTAEKVSFDDGETWSENTGDFFPVEEQSAPFARNPDGTISISNVSFKRVK